MRAIGFAICYTRVHLWGTRFTGSEVQEGSYTIVRSNDARGRRRAHDYIPGRIPLSAVACDCC
jgi:hypothetical protein